MTSERFRNLYGDAPQTPQSGLGRLELDDVNRRGPRVQPVPGARTYGYPPDAVPPPPPPPLAGHRPGPSFQAPNTGQPLPPRPAAPSGVELAERLGHAYGSAIALRAQLRDRIVECERWADRLSSDPETSVAPPGMGKEYAAEAMGLHWGLGAVERIISALDGEQRPVMLRLPDALPGMIPDSV